MKNNSGPEQEQEQYSFLQEKIKNDTVDRKKIMHNILKTIGKGLIFGVAVSIGFFTLKPWAETVFHKNPKEVTIQKDDEMEEQAAEETKPISQALTIDDYKELNNSLNQVAREAKKSIVEVFAVQDKHTLITKNTDENSGVAGVIFADNGQELLILANTSILQDGKTLKVKFIDDTECNASLKKKDNNIGMAILAVSKREIQDSVWSKIKMASLGNSHALVQGKTLIAVGNLFGHKDGVAYGTYSSGEHSMSRADGEYHVLVTDMPGASKSTGALFDINGNIIGVLQPEFLEKESGAVMGAFGISAIKNEIELMANSKDVPYIGIVGVMVPKEVAKAQNIPEGLYVKEVEEDSPALIAGIQSGDVITNIGTDRVESLAQYHHAVIKLEIGKDIQIKGKRRGADNYVEIGFDVTVGIKE